jgi:hypothetical protein
MLAKLSKQLINTKQFPTFDKFDLNRSKFSGGLIFKGFFLGFPIAQ